ncbi:integrase core domain-containing protein, partial [Falsigemmobacter faecalis]
RFGEECLSAHGCMTLANAKEKMETWLSDDNTERPHGAIGDKTPCELANPGPASGPSPGQTPENSSLG